MRFLIVNLLATALLFIGASTASARSLTSSSPDAGPELAVGDQVTITVSLDTEGTDGITLLSVSINVDAEFLEYRGDLSSATTYLLYQAGKAGGPYLTAAANPPELRFATDNQVNMDFTATDLLVGTGVVEGYSEVSPTVLVPGGQLAILVFDVIGTPPNSGITSASLSISQAGNVIAGPGTTGTASLGPDLDFQVPEPGIASLSLAALLTVGALRTRSRRAE